MVCKLEVVFLVIAVEDGWLIPTAGSADGGYLIAVLRSDGVGAIAELEVLGLGEVLYQSLADGLGLALRDVLIEVEKAACHSDLGIGAEVGTGASDNILTKWVDDSGVERVIGCPLTYKPVEAVVLAGTSGIVAQQVVP